LLLVVIAASSGDALDWGPKRCKLLSECEAGKKKKSNTMIMNVTIIPKLKENITRSFDFRVLGRFPSDTRYTGLQTQQSLVIIAYLS
jgi:hypothetical protein